MVKKSWYETETERLEKLNKKQLIDICLSGSRNNFINHKTIIKEPFKIGGDECVDLSEKTIKQKQHEQMIEAVKSIQKLNEMFLTGIYGFPL